MILINQGQEDFVVNSGDRIAQLVFAKYALTGLKEVKELDMTDDRGGGWGHSGIK